MSYGRNYLFGEYAISKYGGPLSVVRVLYVPDINSNRRKPHDPFHHSNNHTMGVYGILEGFLAKILPSLFEVKTFGIMAGQPTPRATFPTAKTKGLIAGLIKGNQWFS